MTARLVPPARLSPRGPLLATFVLAVAIHAGWASTIGAQEDWDGLYYGHVARNIADGSGAVVDSLWTLTWIPDELPAPADTYWQPLPSRVMVPGRWVAGDDGAVAVEVLLAAAWAPLAVALAAATGAKRATCVVAGVVAATGGAWARLATATDTFAVFGVIGGVGLLGIARRRPLVVAGAAAAAVLTRSDGLLVAGAFAVAMWFDRSNPRRWAAAPVLGAGLALIGWTARTAIVAGRDAVGARSVALRSADYLDVFDGVVEARARLGDRIAAVVDTAPSIGGWWLGLGLGIAAPALVAGGWRLRQEAWVRAVAAVVVVAPFLLVFAAPAVGPHGSITRLLVAAVPGACALLAVGVDDLAERAARWRGYRPAVVSGAIVAAAVIVAVGMGWRRASDPVPLEPDCTAVGALDLGPTEPVFTSDALPIREHCGRPSVMITRSLPPEVAASVADRFGIRYALTSAAAGDGQLGDADVPTVLPGWVEAAPGVWARP